MVMVLPMYEIVQPGLYYNTAAVIDADGTLPRQVPQAAHPAGQGLLGEVLLPARQRRVPVFDTAVGKVGVYICYDRHFPEGWRALGLNGAEIVFNPSATHRGLSEYIWRIEQPAAAVANMYYVGAINRVGIEAARRRTTSTARATSSTPRASSSATSATRYKPELIVRDLDMDKIREVRDRWAFYRDRRPDAYDELVER